MATGAADMHTEAAGTFYYDLMASEMQLEPQTHRERVVTAIKLGYDAVAMIHQAGPRVSDTDRCTLKPVELDVFISASRGLAKALLEVRQRAAKHGNGYTFRQLTRINVPVDDANTAQASCSNTAVIGSYDIVAVQPQSERAFVQACTSLDVDVISLDLSKRLPYRFKPSSIQAAITRGVYFEILYAAALRDPGSRKQLFTNVQALCRETRGRNVVVSSGARTSMELRGPLDVMNLATFLGLTQQQAHTALGKSAADVLHHAWVRKAHRGTLVLRVRHGVADDQTKAGNSFARMHSADGGQVGMEVD